MGIHKFAICIVTKNRIEELQYTLNILENMGVFSKCTVYVFFDGESVSEQIKKNNQLLCYNSNKPLGASLARKFLFEYVKEPYIIGFDDDSHPIDDNFLDIVEEFFDKNKSTGIIAFAEVKGIYSKCEILEITEEIKKNTCVEVSEFIGCGYAIRKDVYDKTSGFPEFIDIYGEESFLSLEVFALNYKIIFCPQIVVHHRVNRFFRNQSGYNIFRFEKQLKNAMLFYYRYYTGVYLMKKNIVLLQHNFIKYGIKDWNFFVVYIKAIYGFISTLIKFKRKLKFKIPMHIVKQYETKAGCKMTY